MESLTSAVVAANVEIYREMAETYDRAWVSVLGPELDPLLERDLDFIAARLSSSNGVVRCLDCGAGTGALTLRMLHHGWHVTAVDVSPEMLQLLSGKLARQGLSATVINASISDYLSQPGQSFQLVGFHSVLHHIYDYLEVLDAAVNRLAPGGFLYTNVDPVVPAHLLWANMFDAADTALAKLFCDPSDLIPGMLRRIKKSFAQRDPLSGRKVGTAGDLAEFYARSGLDDGTIVERLRAKGLTIYQHSRYPIARTRPARSINRLCKLKQEFKIIARKPE